MEFHQRLASLRERAGLSQDALAEACDHRQGWLGNIERGEGYPRVPDLYKLAAKLNVHPGELLAEIPSQDWRLDDETMAQGLELLYLMADARPEDKRLQRPSWAMIKIAAKAVQRAEDSPREAMAAILAELSKET